MPASIPRPVLNTVSVSSYSCPKFLYLCILKNLSVDCFQYRRSSVWSYIFLLNGQDKKPKQNSSQTKRHSHQQEAKSARRRTAVSGTLRWLASLHCLLYFLAFDWLRPAVQFKKNRTAGLSWSNARKYNRQCRLANQRKVPVTTCQKKFRWLTAVRWQTLLASCSVAVNVVLVCCCFVLSSCPDHLKGKCMTKLMKVWIGNNQCIDSWKCTSMETLDKNKKTLILVFRCWRLIQKPTDKVFGNRLR